MTMTWQTELRKVMQGLTARQAAAAVSPLLSVRTVQCWLDGTRKPPGWAQAWVLACVGKKARRLNKSNAEDDR
jgi:hypothetical protein